MFSQIDTLIKPISRSADLRPSISPCCRTHRLMRPTGSTPVEAVEDPSRQSPLNSAPCTPMECLMIFVRRGSAGRCSREVTPVGHPYALRDARALRAMLAMVCLAVAAVVAFAARAPGQAGPLDLLVLCAAFVFSAVTLHYTVDGGVFT